MQTHRWVRRLKAVASDSLTVFRTSKFWQKFGSQISLFQRERERETRREDRFGSWNPLQNSNSGSLYILFFERESNVNKFCKQACVTRMMKVAALEYIDVGYRCTERDQKRPTGWIVCRDSLLGRVCLTDRTHQSTLRLIHSYRKKELQILKFKYKFKFKFQIIF